MHRLLLPVCLIFLTHCGVPKPPVCHRVPVSSRAAPSALLETARSNWQILADASRKSDWPAAQNTYNQAVQSLFDQLRCGPDDWEIRAAKLNTTIAPPDRFSADPDKLDAIFPSKNVRVRNKDRHHIQPGLGIPAVSWQKTTPVGVPRQKFFPPNGQPRNITVVLNFSTNPPQWHLSKRWLQNNYPVGKNQHTLAADWSSPVSFFWEMCELDDLRIQNVILPERFTKETGLYFLQPYDPEKIPLVMVHGLVSSPDAYRHIINDLSPEPWFRDRYQIWLYNYPTGNPWLYSAMRFREHMNHAAAYARSKGHDLNLNQMVILAHSMGGLITRASISDPANHLYDAHFRSPLEELDLKPSSKELIRQSLLYKPLTEPKRVVFMAVPHKGSPMANLRSALLISNIIRLPKTLTIDLVDATLQSTSELLGETNRHSRPPTSISSLSPRSTAFKGLNAVPFPEHVALHSIIGDRGHGDTPQCSDGVVPYWSSHIPAARSEKIVPCDHGVPDHPATSEEIKRILLLHLQ